MRASRSLVFCLALAVCVFLAACGGGGTPKPPAGAPVITSSNLPQASVNVPYSFYVQASGGTGSYSWAISAGHLPPGLTFNSMTAQISGTPTAAGSYMFTVKVTDAASMSSTTQLTISVTGALLINCTSCITNTNTLPTGNPGVPYSATFTASGGVGAYVWCVIEMNGTCDDGSGGALPPGLTMGANTGMITGTPTAATPPTQIMVFVHDSELIESRGSMTVSLSIFGVVTASLPTGDIYVPYNQQLMLAGGIGPYSWCVMESGGTCDNGTGGALPPGLSLSPTCTNTHLQSCTLSGTPTQAGTFPFVIQVTDSEHPQSLEMAQFSIDISGVTNSLLNGHFIFALNGFKNGNPFVMVSAFIADGNGNITNGFLDLNDGSGETIDSHGNVIPQSLTTGSVYNLNADGTGTLTIVTNKPATYRFEIVASSNACTPSLNMSACGQIIVRDPSNPAMYGSGVLKVQDSNYFTEHGFFPGSFALRVEGTDPNGNRFGAAGALSFNSGTLVDIDCTPWGLSTGCPLDQNDSGQVFSNSIRGSFSSTIDAMTGRGNFADMSFPSDPNNICLGTQNNFACAYAYYIVNYAEMILISANPISKPANLTVWSGLRQLGVQGGWTLTALNGVGVAQLTALDPNGPKADITAGLLNSDGTGNATLNSDENDGGTLNQQQSSQGTYAIDSTGQKTGKVTFSGFNTQFGNNPPILYLAGSNTGYFVGTDSKVTSGVLQIQMGSPFGNGSVKGVYAGGTISSTLSAVTDSLAFLFADGLGNFNGAQYTSGPGGPGGPNSLMLSYNPVDNTGRAVVTQGGNTFGILYVVSPDKFVMVPAGNNPALNVFVSGPGT